jgi:protein-S-isoprenylcysteine O-methyltransferase Ste14
MARGAYLLFGVIAYAVFFAVFLYLIAFVGNLPEAPRTVDRGGGTSSLPVAIALNLALIALFGLQHSVMARQGFKAHLSRIVPKPVERSVYVLCASVALILLFLFWQPIPATVWSVEAPAARALLWAFFAAGWLIVLVSTFLISHFELFGLAQVWRHARGGEAAPAVFRQPFFYKHVRHPIYSGFFLAFWATPDMSAGHLLLALGMSVYMLIGIRHEERDLVGMFGADYEDYRGRVGMLAPRPRRRTD